MTITTTLPRMASAITVDGSDRPALVSTEDLPDVLGYRWHLLRRHSAAYVVANGPGGTLVQLARLILGVEVPHVQVDHINGDTLDNRRENLRLALVEHNNRNRRPWGACSFKGVHHVDGKGWRARITIDGKKIHLGYHTSAEDAADAYDAAALAHWGEFAYLNAAGR